MRHGVGTTFEVTSGTQAAGKRPSPTRWLSNQAAV